MVTDEMVERVARAICVANGEDPDWWSGDPQDDPNGAKEWMRYKVDARAALAAMTETPAPLSHTGVDRG